MTGRPVIVIGAGGHATVVAEALRAEGRRVLGFSAVTAGPDPLPGLSVLGADADLDADGGYDLVNGIGGTGAGAEPDLRRRIQQGLEARGFRFTGVRHPTAIVSDHARIGEGAQLMAGCIIQAGASIGPGSLINTAVIVEHGCALGAFVHCASGSVLCGDVEVGDGGHIGAGAVVRQGVRLEPGVVVGAGAVVLDPGLGPGALIGAPAKRRVIA